MELNVLDLRPRTFNCQLENVKSQKGYIFNLVNGPALMHKIATSAKSVLSYEGLLTYSNTYIL